MQIKKIALGVLASGRGSNLQAIIDNIEAGQLDAHIRIVISDVKDACAMQRAAQYGIKTCFIDPKQFKGRENYDQVVAERLKAEGVELVILAGYMRILSSTLVREFPYRIMNIHPALLPAFPGLHVQRKALEYGVKFSGCTVHFVDEGLDTGPIILQAVVPVQDDDNEESLSARILEQEHKLYSRAIQLYSEGRLQIEGRRVRVET
ncbi:MAG: phosphoribosylglycinamide formyltransferase [Candidatus Schekmanbacteria bacterium]|nr:phosphoribosylglycinamide formyltransferase [Candidatus Schekmanbacteria bacterium]